MIRHAHMIFVNALFLRAFIYAHTPAQLTTGRNAVMLVCFTTASVKILGRYVGSGGRNSEARMAKYCCTRPYSKKPKPLERSTVRGLSFRHSTAGHRNRQPSATPSRDSNASRPKRPGVILNSPVSSLMKKYKNRKTI